MWRGVVTAVLGTDVAGELPPPPPLVNIGVTSTTSAITMTATIPATSKRIRRASHSSSGVGEGGAGRLAGVDRCARDPEPSRRSSRGIASVASYAPGAAVGSSTTKPVTASSPSAAAPSTRAP